MLLDDLLFVVDLSKDGNGHLKTCVPTDTRPGRCGFERRLVPTGTGASTDLYPTGKEKTCKKIEEIISLA
jgi:hypothetical protein